jgi:hypothetical protein
LIWSLFQCWNSQGLLAQVPFRKLKQNGILDTFFFGIAPPRLISLVSNPSGRFGGRENIANQTNQTWKAKDTQHQYKVIGQL